MNKKRWITRSGGDSYGMHRVLTPPGALPQGAKLLDNALPIYQNELLLSVDRLHLDSASFHQLQQESKGDLESIQDKIISIVKERGKMENPVTGSGGMLLGRVEQIGPEYPGDFQEGDRVATLVSLTLTPLHLDEIESIQPDQCEVKAKGHAVLFASGVAAKIPDDIDERLTLGVLDVCGAPAWVKRLVQSQSRVLILGSGRAGILSALAAREVIPPENLTLADYRPRLDATKNVLGNNIKVLQTDATQAAVFLKALNVNGGGDFDLVVNTCNVPETETAALLATRQGGTVLYFNMATSFQRAVLSAEGLGRDVTLVMGNGYAQGHWEYALNLVRRNPAIKDFF